MNIKTIAVLVGGAVVALAVIYFVKGFGYTFTIVATATFCWLVPFKTAVGWAVAVWAWSKGKLLPKKTGDQNDTPKA